MATYNNRHSMMTHIEKNMLIDKCDKHSANKEGWNVKVMLGKGKRNGR